MNWVDIIAKVRDYDPGRVASNLLHRTDTVLMVADGRLYDLLSGQDVELADSPQPVADAALRLLSTQGGDLLSRNILLLLSPAEFLAKSVKLPGVARDAVRAALQLQSHALLPACEEPLLFACHPDNPQLVLWIRESTVESLSSAFADRGLFLNAVMPRTAILAGAHRHAPARSAWLEQDHAHITLMVAAGQRITGWEQSLLADLQQDDFAAEWKQLINALGMDDIQRVHGADTYCRAVAQTELTELMNSVAHYAVYTQAALSARYRFTRTKQKKAAAAVAVAAVLMATAPFVFQSVQARILLAQLDGLRQQAAAARTDQAVVRDFESQWGVVTEFPRQNVPGILTTLQQVIAPSVLTAIELEEGYISIEGDSQDPQNLLEQLERNPLFTEVDFSRATNNNRYFIDLRLTTVNFPAYQQWYFPESN
jgi:hypothetical protein